MEQLLRTITFTIIIVDVLKNVISMSTSKQEDEVETKVERYSEIHVFILTELIIVLPICALVCIVKIFYSRRRIFAACLRQLWYSFVLWISSLFLCRYVVEVFTRQEVNETELSQNQEEMCNLSTSRQQAVDEDAITEF